MIHPRRAWWYDDADLDVWVGMLDAGCFEFGVSWAIVCGAPGPTVIGCSVVDGALRRTVS